MVLLISLLYVDLVSKVMSEDTAITTISFVVVVVFTLTLTLNYIDKLLTEKYTWGQYQFALIKAFYFVPFRDG